MPDGDAPITLPPWIDIRTLIGFVTGIGVLVGQWYILNDRMTSNTEKIIELQQQTRERLNGIDANVAGNSVRLYKLEQSDGIQDFQIKNLEEALRDLRNRRTELTIPGGSIQPGGHDDP